MESLKILVVEDEPADFKLIERTLRRMEGFKVKVKLATDLPAAHIAADQQEFDAALIDYSVCGDCGLDLVPHLSSPEHKCAPILLTGQFTQAVHRHALSAGVVASLPKDRLDPVLLGTAIRHGLQNRHLLSALHSCSDELARARNEKLDVAANFTRLLGNSLQPVVNCAAGVEQSIAGHADYSQVASQVKWISDLTSDLKAFCHDTSALVTEIHTSAENAACVDLQMLLVDVMRLIAKRKQLPAVHVNVAYLDHPLPVRGNESALLRALVDIITACVAHMMPNGRLDIKLAATTTDVCLGIGSFHFSSRPDDIRLDGALRVARGRALLERYGGELELRETPEPNGGVVFARLPLTSRAHAQRYSSVA
jgi:CheY-like chemotaxis protein